MGGVGKAVAAGDTRCSLTDCIIQSEENTLGISAAKSCFSSPSPGSCASVVVAIGSALFPEAKAGKLADLLSVADHLGSPQRTQARLRKPSLGTMTKEDYAELQATGRVPATNETFISPSGEYASKYSGVTVRFSVRAGTSDALAGLGVPDSSALTGAMYPDMPLVASGWALTSAFFKGQGPNLINIGLGRGTALDIFNEAVAGYEVVP